MTILERKRKYKAFEEEVKKVWKYNVQKSIFNKSISPKGAFYKYATGGTKDNGKFSEDIMNNPRELFKYFVAHLLNDSKESKFKWWFVDSDIINNVFLDENKKEFIIFMNKFNSTNYELSKTKTTAENIYEYFINSDSANLLKSGISKSLTAYICGDFKNKFYSSEKEKNIRDVYSKKIVWITNNDYHGTIEKNNSEYNVWGLPSIFSKIKFMEFQNYSDSNLFTVKSDFNDNQMKYIDVKGSSKNANNGRVVVVPIQVSELVSFISDVKDEHGTIDSLFTLNVRDRKKSKNKVSDSIINSILDNPEHFLMLNNGITAIVDKIDISISNNEPNIKFENIKIINGQQTSNTLYKHYYDSEENAMPKQYFEARILMKAYMVPSNASDESKYEIYNAISNASNSQNAIKAKDLLSTRKFNMILQQKLLRIGINYSYRDGVSDFSMQLSKLPKITLNELVKMHYIFLSGEAWKRGSIGKVFDSIIGLQKPRQNSALYTYSKLFNTQSPEDLSEQLVNIATLQLFYRNKKKELGNEVQSLDLLIYLALVMQKYGQNGYGIEIEKFVSFIEYFKPKDVDSNNLYKSAKHIPFLIDRIFTEYNLSETEEYIKNKEFLK
ncbi:AIPR family protein [Mycoplasma marinum]|uniref:Abortive phage infection protein C-terminal domain-containing protein n=1 Tax=Mycoplasma marinum TaxID=1937190 RepID=A0A4R0XKJ0_9MOLU|nr:AIPR family protein [Mycoplasma marinum]TCG10974.1 hypothetical protein C4B24_03365 [Mycoplasma marinum]